MKIMFVFPLLLALVSCNKVSEDDPQDAKTPPAKTTVSVITAVACGTETPVRCVTSVLLTEGKYAGRICSVSELLGSRGDTVRVRAYTGFANGPACDND